MTTHDKISLMLEYLDDFYIKNGHHYSGDTKQSYIDDIKNNCRNKTSTNEYYSDWLDTYEFNEFVRGKFR